MKKLLLIALMAAVATASAPFMAAAQEAEETSTSYGTVTQVSTEQIVVSEYNYDTDTNESITYAFDPKVEIKNVASIKDIAVNDNVEINFLVKDGKKIAKVVSVEKPEPEEGAAPAEGTEQPAPADVPQPTEEPAKAE
jgi:hypothetical protein